MVASSLAAAMVLLAGRASATPPGAREARRLGAFQALHDLPPGEADAPAAPITAWRPPEDVSSVPVHKFTRSDAPLRTRYPVVLAHGAAWTNALGVERLQSDYWQGIDLHMRRLGLRCISPVVSPAGSIAERAQALKEAILREWPRKKVNIVAHSMGGLDARYMITMLGMGDHVASLTTLSTPHRGSWYADFAGKYVFQYQGLNWLVGRTKLNIEAINELAVENLHEYFNPTVSDVPGVAYFSYAGVTPVWKLPLYQWGVKLVVAVGEKAAARKGIGRATRSAFEKAIPGGLDAAMQMGVDAQGKYPWIVPEEAGRSDGVVSTSSARWGTYLGEVPAHHLGQIGASNSIDHHAIWEGIVRNLAFMGY